MHIYVTHLKSVAMCRALAMERTSAEPSAGGWGMGGVKVWMFTPASSGTCASVSESVEDGTASK